MAGIDKTYTKSYRQYKLFKEWAESQIITFFDNHKVKVSDYVYDLEKEDFDGREMPIMNTPTFIDIYLIQKCKIKFVIDRMNDVYDKEDIEKFKKINLSANPPKEFEQNRKIIISKTKTTLFPIHNKPYLTKFWWLQCNDNFWFNDETKKWIHEDFYYPTNTNTYHPKSLKSLVRHLRKQYLPNGISFTLSGRYVGENYLITIK